MTLDNEKQRQVLLQLIASANIPGNALEFIVAFKAAITQAKVVDPPIVEKENKTAVQLRRKKC